MACPRYALRLTAFFVLSAGLTCACSTNFYGHSEAQWRELSPAEREAAIREFGVMVQAERDRAHRARFVDPIKQSIIDRGLEEIAP